MSNFLDWPVPLGYGVPGPHDPAAPETCLAAFNDGSSQMGALLRFAPHDGLVEVRSRGAPQPRLVILSELKSLSLTRLLEPLADDAKLPDLDLRSLSAALRDRFELEFFDGATMTGETWGFNADDRGLFLFLVNRNGTLTRFYAPNGAVKSFRMLDQQSAPVAWVGGQDAPPEPPPPSGTLASRRFDGYVQAADIATAADLQRAFTELKKAPWLMLGDAVIQEGLISPPQLQQALQRQHDGQRQPLGDILVDLGFIERGTVNKLLARQLGIPYVDLHRFQRPDPAAIELLPAEVCRRHVALPLVGLDDGSLVVAMEDPMAGSALQELAFFARRKIQPVMASDVDIRWELDAAYGPTSTARESSGAELVRQLDPAEAPETEHEDATIASGDSTLVRLVNRVILEAIEQGASDIHVETYADQQPTLVRLRKDGTLVPHLEVPAAYSAALVSRLKIMCQLDIAERRKPQDGKIKFRKFGPADVELRVATIPTTNGLEDVVLRVLSAGKPIPLHKLDLSPRHLTQLTRIAERPHGLCLVCGPTGSGKTTTLHSVLNHVNVPGRKIWTAEDPIEITQAGLRQVQVNPRIGWTFAAAMRTFLRADPDIIMLGEIRDAETAKVAIEGSLTGHFVYSTLHTNSAPESIVRLLDLGADPFNFADALQGILAQRLAKRLCLQCRTPHTVNAGDLAELLDEYCMDSPLQPADILQEWATRFADPRERYTLYEARGCPACNQTGYRGRIGLHELLAISPTTKRLVQTRATVAELLAAAMAEGMRTLKQDGIEKVLMGHTDIQQVRSVCG